MVVPKMPVATIHPKSFDESVNEIMDILRLGAHMVASAALAKKEGGRIPTDANCEDTAIEMRLRRILLELLHEQHCNIHTEFEKDKARHQARLERRARVAQRFAEREKAEAVHKARLEGAENNFPVEYVVEVRESLVNARKIITNLDEFCRTNGIHGSLRNQGGSPQQEVDIPQALTSPVVLTTAQPSEAPSRPEAPFDPVLKIQASYRAKSARDEFKKQQEKNAQSPQLRSQQEAPVAAVLRIQATYRAKTARDEFKALAVLSPRKALAVLSPRRKAKLLVHVERIQRSYRAMLAREKARRSVQVERLKSPRSHVQAPSNLQHTEAPSIYLRNDDIEASISTDAVSEKSSESNDEIAQQGRKKKECSLQ